VATYYAKILYHAFPVIERRSFTMTKFINRGIPLKALYADEQYLLLSISAYRAYKDGKPTNKIEGYKYEVAEMQNFDKFSVKIKGQDIPLLQPEELKELRDNGEKIFVEFVNAVDKLYIHREGNSVSVEDSFSADDVLLVEQD